MDVLTPRSLDEALRLKAERPDAVPIQGGTVGGTLGTSSPAGDAHPPLLVEGAEVEVASIRGSRRLPFAEFFLGPKRNALERDELVLAVRVTPSGQPQTFMKVGPRNAMV